MSEMKADVMLDAKGLHCPMPVLKTRKAIDAMQKGQILEVNATDPASKNDIPALLERLGHELVHTDEKEGVFTYVIKKK